MQEKEIEEGAFFSTLRRLDVLFFLEGKISQAQAKPQNILNCFSTLISVPNFELIESHFSDRP